MAPESLFSISAASVVEDVLQQHGSRLNDIDMASRKAEEAATRRYEAASWLRQTVGAVSAKELPEEPSEEEFRLGLRNGLILCIALNKVQPGAIPRVVENPGDSVVLPDGAALSAYQYFENIRNFLVAAQEMGLPMFEASDLEKGGKSARVVNSILALKSYSEWQQSGGNGSWRYGGNLKPINSGKFFVRKNSELFMNSLSRNSSMNQSLNGLFQQESTETEKSSSLNTLVRAVLSDKRPEEVPTLVESILNKVMEELELRIASQNELVKMNSRDHADGSKSSSKRKVLQELVATPIPAKTEIRDENKAFKEDFFNGKSSGEELKRKLEKRSLIFERQQKDIQELKHTLHTTKAGMQFMQMKYSEEFCNLGKHVQSLAHAASGYHKVLEENRRLYNQVQDLKGSIRVYCRVRPFFPGQSSPLSTVGHLHDGGITILTPSKYGKEGSKSFSFNKVFGPSATQDEVFSDTQPLIRSVLDGYNVCIFAYGQTGSGKTYTMSGPKEITKESQGVNYRALSDLFSLSEQRKETFSYHIAVQMIEIYNEQVRDLLADDGLNKKLEIRNSSQTGLNVPDANLVHVASTSDVIELMNIGQRNRAVGATALNDRSSRSHSCLTVHVQGKEIASGTILRGCMHLVDLAGSERVNKSEVTGDRLKEAQHINKSLSALGDVIAALAQKNSHVPYRNSKLTQLLQDSLGGQAKTLMFVHISPEADAVGETISTLKFAERVSTVELGAAQLNKENSEVKELKEEIASLKEALARKNGEPGNIRSVMPSPDIQKVKSGAPSPIYSNRQRGPVGQSNHSRHQSEDERSVKSRSNSSSTGQKKPSSDIRELLMSHDSTPWLNSNPKGDKNETRLEDWVDKVMANKQEIRDDDSLGDWRGESTQLPELFYQSYASDVRVFPDQQYDRNGIGRKENQQFGIQRTQSEYATTDDSDEFDIATIDSSEADMLWQYNHRDFATMVSASGSRIKKPQPRPIPKSPEIRTPIQPCRTPIQPHGLSSSRKIPNGSMQTPNRNSRQLSDGKRQFSSGKTGSRK